MTKKGVPMTLASSQSARTSGTGTSVLASARMIRYSRSTACADGRSAPGGFFLRTSATSPAETQ